MSKSILTAYIKTEVDEEEQEAGSLKSNKSSEWKEYIIKKHIRRILP